MDIVSELLLKVLKSRGFKKKTQKWFWRLNGEVENHVFDTKSRFSGDHVIDVGLIHPLVPVAIPGAAIGWHVNARLELAFRSSELLQALDAEECMPNERRAEILIQTFDKVDELLFNKYRTLRDLEEFALLDPTAWKPFSVPPALPKYARLKGEIAYSDEKG